METSKISGLIGICKKAGKMTVGTDMTADGIRAGKRIVLVLVASDASDNTVKRIGNCCVHYGVGMKALTLSSPELGHLIGKTGSVSVVGITDDGFAKAILKLMKGQVDSYDHK